MTDAPAPIFLKDYTPANFAVEAVNLTIALFDEYARVSADLTLSRKSAGDLVLNGRALELVSVKLDGAEVAHKVGNEHLTVKISDDIQNCTLSTVVNIHPNTNTSLEGLYKAGDGDETMFVTQCEPEGFQKITYYLDRPDVMSVFTVRLEADKRYQTLLANGNLLDSGDIDDERHFALWHDPFKKPSYLFAAVFANLDVLEDSYTTSENREVLLQIYAKTEDIDKCHVPMQALKDSMRWDEENYGLPYDLDRFMIVAVSQFNMGAMENKGLNIFNSACVLSSPDTATDERNIRVKAIIAHEYFHNWTGNRITCRDWFQLCLKEGFTVFREQQFTADISSPAVQRIADVSILKLAQFAEDAGPLAHAVRPRSFVEINNFYTATVYEKGAEIVSMLYKLLGKDKFRQATDLYFKRFDGQAITIEDFLAVMSQIDPRAAKFSVWYDQAGTPTLHANATQDGNTLTLHLSQSMKDITGNEPMPMVVDMAILQNGNIAHEETILFEGKSADYRFNLPSDDRAVVSLLRDFSAPVILDFEQSDDDLLALLAHEPNGYNRWQAQQTLTLKHLLNQSKKDDLVKMADSLIKAVDTLKDNDPMLAARLFDIPSEKELALSFDKEYDPKFVQKIRTDFKQNLGELLGDKLLVWHDEISARARDYEDTPKAAGVRALQNAVLDLALAAGIDGADVRAKAQYKDANCLSQTLGALSPMARYGVDGVDGLLDEFYVKNQADELLIDEWFMLKTRAKNATISDIKALTEHADFDYNTPNRVRSVLGPLAGSPARLWSDEGMDFYLAMVAALDGKNPQLAARLLQAFENLGRLTPSLQTRAREKLGALVVHSKNAKESLNNLVK